MPNIDHDINEIMKLIFYYKCDALRDLVPFVQFKNLKKHP